MTHQGRCIEVVNATQTEIVNALLHYESYPEWQAGVLGTDVLERDDQGRGSLIAMRVDAKVRQLRVVVRVSYDDPHTIRCEYVTGDVKDYRARYSFAARDDGTTSVTYEVAVEPGFPLPATLKKMLTDRAVTDTLDSLKKRVEI